MGEVYRARDTRLGRDVAIKLLPDSVAGHPERRARLEREARALASLAHSGIATLHEVVEVEGQLALVMELVEGENLAQRLEGGPLPVPLALDLGGQIAAALDHAHQRGILHRDLKPSNVVLSGEGRIKLLDFGLAKVTSSTAETLTTPASTETGVVLGTAPYMSPEQARGEDVDRRTDVWAFGCVLYEMLCGRRAFPGSTRADTIASVLGAEPDWRRLPETTPSGVRRLLRRCLQKNQAERLRDMGDAALEIKEAVQSGSVERDTLPRRLGLPPGPWRKAILWFSAVCAVAAIGLATRRAVAPTTRGELPRTPPAPSRASASFEGNGAALDIRHEPIGCFVAGRFALVEAVLEPSEIVGGARVYFKSALGDEHYFVEMAPSDGGFRGKLPMPTLAASPVSYHIVGYTRSQAGLIESGRTSEFSAVVVSAPSSRSASDPVARAACPTGARIATFGPPGAVTVYSAGEDLAFSLKTLFGLEELLAALRDPNPRVREEAANSLGAIGPATTKAIALAIGRLEDSEPNVREEAASSLTATGRRLTLQVITALVETLKDPNPRVRVAAARALGEIGPGVAAAVVALRHALKDPVAQVRKAAAEALGSVGTVLSPAIAALETEYQHSEGMSEEAAREALDKIQAALSESPSPRGPPR